MRRNACKKERRGFAPHPTRGMIPLDPHERMLLSIVNHLGSRCCLEEPLKSEFAAWCFWPGGEAANPDALRPGKAWE